MITKKDLDIILSELDLNSKERAAFIEIYEIFSAFNKHLQEKLGISAEGADTLLEVYFEGKKEELDKKYDAYLESTDLEDLDEDEFQKKFHDSLKKDILIILKEFADKHDYPQKEKVRLIEAMGVIMDFQNQSITGDISNDFNPNLN